MKIESPEFKNNDKIPQQFTCDGPNISPPLTFSEVPENTKSLVLIMDDPDIPEGAKKSYGIQVWDHWTVFNIPPETTEIPEGQNPAGLLGRNTRGDNAYGGPCPPDRQHRYFFKLYALDTTLDLPPGSTKTEVETAMHGHVLEKVELIGLYQRQS